MDKKRINYLSYDFMVAVLLIAAAVLVMFFAENVRIRTIAIAVVFVVAVLYYLISAWTRQRMAYLANGLLTKYAESIDKYVNAASIPTAIIKPAGRVLWHNPAFFLLAGRQAAGMNLYRLFEHLSKPEKDKKVKIGEKVYVKEEIHATLNEKEYTIFRLIDVAKDRESVDLHKNVLATVCHLQIDNYGDLLRGTQQSMQTEVTSEIERIIARHAQNIRAVYQKYERNKYILVFERRYLSGLMQSKFSILEEVRKIDTGNAALRPTLSLGVGVAGTPAEANTSALKALEMALGRGGDQAVLKDEHEYKFYGGIQQGQEKRTRVKSRMFASALRNLMEQCDRVVIMGHDVPDLDCMGAALGLLACARRINKRVNIVMEKPNVSIQRLVEAMRHDPDYKDVLATPSEAETVMDEQTMLIIVDTQIADFTIAPQLFKYAQTTVVIDHHVRGTNHIENPTLFLHEPYASSTCEMVTEIVQYFAENIVLKPLELEALMAGITIDTKGFSFKTGARTFEAASYLRRLGADTTRIRHLFQDDLKTYTARAKVVESAQMIDKGIAIAICPRDIENPQLLAAQAADALLSIIDINASFVLCEQDGMILISGRSIGEINVQRILEKMGGGGHATIAGAQIKNKTMQQTVDELKEMIREYEEEV